MTSSAVVLSEEQRLTRNWIVNGVVMGIMAVVAYSGAIAPTPIPDRVRIYLGIAFGPLLSVALVGLYHFLKLHRKTMVLQTATLFGIIAGTLVNLMLVVQAAIFETIPEEEREGLGLAFDGLNMVQLGIDVSWDIFFSLATVLFGVAMFHHPRFGTIWGVVMVLVGGGLLVLNLATFPDPPGEAGSVDLGPLSGVLYLFVSIRVLRSLSWVDERLGSHDRDRP